MVLNLKLLNGNFSLPLIATINPNNSDKYIDRSFGVQSQSEFVSRLKKLSTSSTPTTTTPSLKEKIDKLFDTMERTAELPHQTTQSTGSGTSLAYYRIYYNSEMLYVSASTTKFYYAEYVGSQWSYTLITNTIDEANNKFCAGQCWQTTTAYTPPPTTSTSGCAK